MGKKKLENKESNTRKQKVMFAEKEAEITRHEHKQTVKELALKKEKDGILKSKEEIAAERARAEAIHGEIDNIRAEIDAQTELLENEKVALMEESERMEIEKKLLELEQDKIAKEQLIIDEKLDEIGNLEE